MNVFLMFSDRDYQIEQELPPNTDALIQDLELNTLFNAMALGDSFLLNMSQRAILCSLSDAKEIAYRQGILNDCLNNAEIVRELYRIPLLAIESKKKSWLGVFSQYPSGILSDARQMLEMFLVFLRFLRQIADDHAGKFHSQGFKRFFSMIQEELNDEYLSILTSHLKELSFNEGVLLSVELGKGNEGTNYILNRRFHKKQSWVEKLFSSKKKEYSYTIAPRDHHGARALGSLRNRGVNLIANAVAQSAEHIDSFFNALMVELSFYIGALNLSEKLAELGEPISFPQPAPSNERCLSFEGLYDICLALTMDQRVVGNDLQADHKELVMITGANQGGKSTFLRSIGIAQIMMQSGMFVPAESFNGNLCERIFTHYKREEDSTMESGKLDEELSRMSDIIDDLSPNSMLLFNESFAATNEREGSEIARQIINALIEQHISIFFVTHLFELANGFYDLEMENAIFLVAERKNNTERTFKMVEGRPLHTSYGIDIYRKVFN